MRREASAATSRIRSPLRTASTMLAWTSRRRSTSWVGMVMTAGPLWGGPPARLLDRWSKFRANLPPRCPMRPGHRARDPSGMERLTALDASFLRVESSTAHMHVGWLATVDLPAGAERLDPADLVARIEGRLHL